MITWQQAVDVARPVAREAWRDESIGGAHAVVTTGCIDAGPVWVVLHGDRRWVIDGDDTAMPFDPPVVVVDKATGEVSVTRAIYLPLEDAHVVGDVPAHLRWD